MDISHLIKQKSYERVVYILRRHWITFIPKAVLFVVLLLIPIALWLLLANLFPQILEGAVFYSLLVLLGSAYYLGVLLFFYTEFIIFYLDMWVVTNDRIVDVEQLGLFARTVSELDLFRIQDVTTDVRGFFATLFNYGIVEIKTASTNVNIVFRDISRPNTVREELIQLSHEDRKYHNTTVIEEES